MKDPTTVAQNWANRLGQSTQAITDGVDRVQVAPGVLAARQKTVWQQNTMASAPKWAANTAKVPLSEWQQSMKDKGIPRISQGAAAAVPKMQAFLTKLLPYVENATNSLPPRGDFQANINRMVQFATKMKAFSNQ